MFVWYVLFYEATVGVVCINAEYLNMSNFHLSEVLVLCTNDVQFLELTYNCYFIDKGNKKD